MRGPPNDVRRGITSNSNLASVYQGVAAKVGTGIIDDPLEAFNRIMKEKEKRKEERRRSTDQRRSRSPDRHPRNRYRSSPVNRRVPREQAPREKHEHFRDKRDRRERDRDNNASRERTFRHKRSTSFSDRSSRSRSWSFSPQRKPSRSPSHYRRSRSRPHNVPNKSKSHGRIRVQHVPTRNTSAEDNILKRDIRSPSPGRREDFVACEAVKKNIHDFKSDALEPPPPGYEVGPPASYQWHQNERNVYKQKTDHFDQKSKADRKNSAARAERSPSKSSSNSKEKKVLRQIRKSPIKKSSEDARHEHDLITKDLSDVQQNLSRENKDYRNDNKHEKVYKHTSSSIQNKTTSSHSSRSNVKEANEGTKLDEISMQLEKKVPSITHESYDEKSHKQNKSGFKVERRVKEKKKKSKKDKIDKKKIKKDRKEKRDQSKHLSSMDENTSIHETDTPLSTEDHKTIEQSTPNTSPFSEKKDKQKLQKHVEKDSENQLSFYEEGEENNKFFEPVQDILSCLYDDVGGEQITSNTSQKEDANKNNENSKLKRNTPPESFNRFDSVLDIHGYETDFEENKPNQKDKTNIAVPVLSKWELDEQNFTPQVPKPLNENDFSTQLADSGNEDKVTNEVLRKAEHAIFARAINAIRPMEAKKQSTEHAYRSSIECSPPLCINKPIENSKDDLKDFQITVPFGNALERSVELKPEKKVNLSHSPKRSKLSIKDRLGSKIVHKDTTPSQVNLDLQKQERSRRERSNDFTFGSNRSCSSSTFRERGRERERERERDRDRDRDRERERERSKDRKYGSSTIKKSYGSSSTSRHRSRERDDNYKSHDNDRRYNKTDTRKKSTEYSKGGSTSDSHYANRKKLDDVNVNFGSNSKKHNNEQNLTGLEKGNCGGDYELNYLDSKITNFEQSRITANPFRKKDIIDIKHAGSSGGGGGGYREQRKSSVGNKQSCSSSESETDPELDDAKRKKKHKERKERKRKRSCSEESTESAPKKHKKKKNKSSKKKKKNKKHQEDTL